MAQRETCAEVSWWQGMITLYFVSALILTHTVPPVGWLVYTKSYSDIKVCEEHVGKNRDSIVLSVGNYMGKKLIEIKDIRCLTMEDATRKNTALGH